MTDSTVLQASPAEIILAETAGLRAELLKHPLYSRITDLNSLQVFMQDHAFAVLDFMWLLKRLQQEFCCNSIPWLPPSNPELSRFINEIVLGEESDQNGTDGYTSHFQLYREAMRETGASTERIDLLTTALRKGATVGQSLIDSGAPLHVVRFVTNTWEVASKGSAGDVATVFCFSREDIIPEMFQRLLHAFESSDMQIPALSYYIRRHIELDGDHHGPLTRRMVSAVCQTPDQIQSAIAAASTAIQRRIELWDGVLTTLQNGGTR